MPQMAPLNWFCLFLMFSITLMMFTVMNYSFNIKSPLKIQPMKKSSFKISWKW